MTSSKPLVSVVMITYGHEAFICEAIEGVLIQETDFEVELIVSNDCSPDETDKVVEAILKNDPRSSMISYTRHGKNLGVISNFNWVLNQAKGQYIAICEGDDYWTDPKKLQKQVDLLESSRAALCHTKAVDSNGKLRSTPLSLKQGELEPLIESNFIITASTMFRTEILKAHTWISGAYPFGDWPLWLTALTQGDLVYLDELTTVYRVNESGVWQNNWKDRIGSDRLQKEVELLHEFKAAFPKYDKIVDGGIKHRLQKLLDYFLETGSFGLILRSPMKQWIKHFPEFKSIQRKARNKYLKAKLGL